MNDLISVIVPVYNVENYLRECIESVLSQEYANFELILINDGSTDSSGDICDEYKLIDKRIIVIHKKNEGSAVARNIGLEIIKGKWVLFLDSDDIIHQNLLKECLELTQNDGDIDIVWYGYSVLGDKRSNTEDDVNFINDIKEYPCPELAMKDIFLSSGDIVVWNKLYSSHLFKDVRFPVGKLIDDEFITFHLVFKACKIIRTYKKYYIYRINSNSVMHSGSIKKKMVIFDAIKERLMFFKENNYTELEEMDYANLFNNLKYFYQVMSNESVAYQDDLLWIKNKFLENEDNFKNNKYITKINKILYRLFLINNRLIILFNIRRSRI